MVLCHYVGPTFCVVASVVCHVGHAVSILLQEHFWLFCRPDGKEDISHFSGSLDPGPQLQSTSDVCLLMIGKNLFLIGTYTTEHPAGRLWTNCVSDCTNRAIHLNATRNTCIS